MNYTSEQMRVYMANRRASRRVELRAILDDICVRCGSIDNLQFDHIDPGTKNFSISGRYLDLPWTTLLEELGKCQLLCEGCHKLKTGIENGLRCRAVDREHGHVKYRKEGCRCEICCREAAVVRKKYRQGRSSPAVR